jgi:hypothetical protein
MARAILNFGRAFCNHFASERASESVPTWQ